MYHDIGFFLIKFYPLGLALIDASWKKTTVSQSVSSVAQSCPTICDPMNHSTPGLPVHHQLPELTQTHAH